MPTTPTRRLLALALLAASVTAASAEDRQAGDLTIAHPWARPSVGRQTVGAAYVTIRNRGGEADRLLAVRTPAADEAAVHAMDMTGDVMTMRPVDGVDVPAGGEADLGPGGTHIMLTGLKKPLVAGETLPMTLVFRRAGEVPVEVSVEKPKVR